MRSRKGFTLIELMIVVVIVAVLAAVVVPLLISRIERAKYSEGKAIASQIATAVRAYVAEEGTSALAAPNLVTNLGFRAQELDGKYWVQGATTMTATGVFLNPDGTLDYLITLTPRTTAGLSQNVVLSCDNNVSTFTSPVGL